MGVYLSTPSREVFVEEGSNNRLTYVVGEMQGWRKTMEVENYFCYIKINILNSFFFLFFSQDEHIANLNVCEVPKGNEDIALFSVFDGHGGKKVSIFSKFYFQEELVSTQAFKEKRYPDALRSAFQRIDDLLHDEKHQVLS
jgi:protein phosphatase 2C family protein 2/3